MQNHTITRGNDRVILVEPSTRGTDRFYIRSHHADTIKEITGRLTLNTSIITALTQLGFKFIDYTSMKPEELQDYFNQEPIEDIPF